MKKLIKILLSSLGALLTGCASYNSAYKPTPVDEIEIKKIPSARILKSENTGDYFSNSNNLFRNLFRYINNNDISMTIPVESGISQAYMIFYVGEEDKEKAAKDQGAVKVSNIPGRTVASLGARGGYSKENVIEAKEKLKKWLDDQDKYTANAVPYAVFWDSPFVLSFLKRFEVHIPVKEK